jgi:tRNA nucleotidyltransferase (CCA-adding enzyme)
LARAVEAVGGRLVVVGGWVRDQLCGDESNDLDLEIFGLSRESISEILRPVGFTKPVGRHFSVWRHTGQALDISYPRAGAELYSKDIPGSLEAAFREASRYRDLTINAIGWDPLARTGGIAQGQSQNEPHHKPHHRAHHKGRRQSKTDTRADLQPVGLIDPWNGRADLEDRRLCAVDATTFGSDPLRVLRVARLHARFAAGVDPVLVELCRELDLGTLPIERITTELRRILAELEFPSVAFDFLSDADQLAVFAPVSALKGVAQDPRWHPEGDVYIHTMQVVDCAAEIARSLSTEKREILLFAALCHDFGKPETTTIEEGRIRSIGHEAKGAERTREWLDELCLPGRHARSITTLVAHHLAPAQFVGQGAGPRAYRRLARKLAAGGVTVVDLERLARADHLGRSVADVRVERFGAGEAFLVAARAAQVHEGVRPDVVSAADLIARGVDPGPLLGRLLARCREIQDDTGLEDAERLVDRVLDESDNDRRADSIDRSRV